MSLPRLASGPACLLCACAPRARVSTCTLTWQGGDGGHAAVGSWHHALDHMEPAGVRLADACGRACPPCGLRAVAGNAAVSPPRRARLFRATPRPAARCRQAPRAIVPAGRPCQCAVLISIVCCLPPHPPHPNTRARNKRHNGQAGPTPMTGNWINYLDDRRIQRSRSTTQWELPARVRWIRRWRRLRSAATPPFACGPRHADPAGAHDLC